MWFKIMLKSSTHCMKGNTFENRYYSFIENIIYLKNSY